MTVSEKIFIRLGQLSMSQKEFSEKTGILPSTISEWKKKKTNPSSEKILPICEALRVTPEWLLSPEAGTNEKTDMDYIIVKKDSDIGRLVAYYSDFTSGQKERIMGYVEAFKSISGDIGEKKVD